MDIHHTIVHKRQYFSTTNTYILNLTKVNPTTIPNPNRLSTMLMSVDEGAGWDSELLSNEQDIAVLAPVGNTLE